jgi:hypothetical protein
MTVTGGPNKQLFITVWGSDCQFAGSIGLQTAVRTDCRFDDFQFRFSDVGGSCCSTD